jgi:hypothetical protein
MDDFTSRVGRFKVSGVFFRRLAPDEGTNLFDRMVVLDVQRNFMTDEREYFCIHPDFRPRVEGEIAPEYTAIFEAGRVHPRWIEKTHNVGVQPPVPRSAGTTG